MAIPAIGAVGAMPPVFKPQTAQPAGFGDALKRGLEQVSGLEQQADKVAQSIATGGPAQIQDLMVATTKSQLAVDLMVQTRNRAVEAYQEIMRMPL